jgi:electron transport complex protein RnfD
LISFPQFLASWPALDAGVSSAATIHYFFTATLPPGTSIDAISQATPLDSIKVQLSQMRTISEITAGTDFSWLAGEGWEWINLAALAGGLWLLQLKIIRWQIPGAMLSSMLMLYVIFYLAEPGIHTPPLIGLFSGATMLGAFFIATDPVSAATTNRGRLIYGAGIGVLCFCIREWGAYPDGIAFAVILMNMAVPLIDRYTLPRVTGRQQRP